MSDEKKKVEIIEHEKPKEITVSTEKLDKVMERLEHLEKENELLTKSVSSSKYKMEKEKLEKDNVMRVRFKLYRGIPIIGIKSLEQTLIMNPMTGAPTMNAKIRYKFLLANKEEVEIPYQEFYTTIYHTEAHVVDKKVEDNYELYGAREIDGIKEKKKELIFTCEFMDETLNEKYGKIECPVNYVNM